MSANGKKWLSSLEITEQQKDQLKTIATDWPFSCFIGPYNNMNEGGQFYELKDYSKRSKEED